MDSPLAYIGGKSKLAKSIIEMIPEHEAYCEVFAGAAWVFFRKEPCPANWHIPQEQKFKQITLS